MHLKGRFANVDGSITWICEPFDGWKSNQILGLPGWKVVSIVSKLVYFTYLRDIFTTYLYRGELICLLSTMDIQVYSPNGGETWRFTMVQSIKKSP